MASIRQSALTRPQSLPAFVRPAPGTKRDLTEDSIARHILAMAAPVAVGMLAQLACQLVDLYFIARTGAAVTAGVNAAGNVLFIISALTQVLAAGSVSLIAHAAGRADQAQANLAFNQVLSLATLIAGAALALMYAFARPYMRSLAADVSVVDAGVEFLYCVLPGFALMLPMAAIGSALRGIGVVQLPIVVYVLTVLLNVALAPVLIAGWGTGIPLGAMGAGLATTASIALGVATLCTLVRRRGYFVSFQPRLMWPRVAQWSRMLAIGLPAGGEFALLFLSSAVAYHAIRDLGAEAQAGFGIGARVLQAALLPALAVALATGPIAAQNYGAHNAHRVRQTFLIGALIAVLAMALATLSLQYPRPLLEFLGADVAVAAAAAEFLRLASWTCMAQALIYICAAMFQGFGNTVPTLIGSATRFIAFLLPALWLSSRPAFHAEQVWYAWIASVLLQAAVCGWLLRREFDSRLGP